MVIEDLGGGKFCVLAVLDHKVAPIKQQLASLNDLKDAHVIGAFGSKKDDLGVALFSPDNSWSLAMVRLTLF